MREIRQSGSEGGARFNPLSLPLSREVRGYALVLVFTLTGVAGLICLIYKSNPL